MINGIMEILDDRGVQYFVNILVNEYNKEVNSESVLEYSDIIKNKILPETSFLAYSNDGTKCGVYNNCPPNIPKSEGMGILVINKNEIEKFKQPIVVNKTVEEFSDCEYDVKSKKMKKIPKAKLRTKVVNEELDKALRNLSNMIDTIRAKHMTMSRNQAQIYADKYAESVALLKDDNPNMDDYPYISAESDAINAKPKSLAKKIISKHNECKLINAKLEAIKMTTKRDLKKIKSVELINKYMDDVELKLAELEK